MESASRYYERDKMMTTGKTTRKRGKPAQSDTAASASGFVGREQALTQLLSIMSEPSDARLVIQSIEGPGGIGKTALFEHVLRRVDKGALQYLTMQVRGDTASARDPYELVQALVASSESAVPLSKPLAQRFTSTEEVRAIYGELMASAKSALQKALPDVPIEQLMRLLTRGVECGQRLNVLIPRSKEYVDFEKVGQHLPRIEEVLKTLPPLLDEVPSVLEKLGATRTVALRNAVRANPLNALADAFATDLTVLLSGYERRNFLRPSQAKVKGVDRLLLVIDDYESLQSHFGEFLVSHLIPKLKQCRFETVVVIIGRDQLALTHPAWNQHHQRQIAPPIPLSTLSREEMEELVRAHGRSSRDELDRAWADTLGYPLLVTLWLEEALEAGHGEGPSIGMLKRFHDRTTHWLTEEQKHWLYHALFLPRVNVETFAATLGDDDEARRAMQWFEGDGSVRDAQGREFKVREYVRSRLADYLETTDPARFRDLQARGGRVVA